MSITSHQASSARKQQMCSEGSITPPRICSQIVFFYVVEMGRPSFGVVVLCRDDEGRYAFGTVEGGWLVSFFFFDLENLLLICCPFRSLPEVNLERETYLEAAISLLQDYGESIVVTGWFPLYLQERTTRDFADPHPGILRVLVSDDQIQVVLAAIPSGDAPARLLSQREFIKGEDKKQGGSEQAQLKYFSIQNVEKEISPQVAERLRRWVEATGVRVWPLNMFCTQTTKNCPATLLFRFVPRCQVSFFF